MPSPADPEAPQSRALHKLGVGAGMKFPTSLKTKRGAVLFWKGLKSVKTRRSAGVALTATRAQTPTSKRGSYNALFVSVTSHAFLPKLH